ncbi:hypothetical protein [Clostridium sp. DSM 8431]|uniref:RHS repeat domain-containing protein n=1 Tax=Clostridium sp. DSM 8431 TaxID=1761781 RepID=UPI001FA91912|nr:hypothetical protein [Clostridium sp. DSM 8431]
MSGNTTRLFYDKNDRIIKQVLPEQYDANTDDGVGTTYKYNVTGQVIEVKNALGQVTAQNTYDPRGNLKTSIDGEKNKVEYTYTLLGQIKDITTPNSRRENKKAQSYSYDARGNITGVIDGDGGTIEYFYNSLGQVSEIKDQEGNSEYFYYDKEGNLTKRIDRNGNNQDRSYNIDGNLTLLEAYTKDKEDKLNVVRQQLEYNPDSIISGAVFNNMYYNYAYNLNGNRLQKVSSFS